MFESTRATSSIHATATELIAPTSGRVVALDEVPDRLYAERHLGPGIAIDPTDGLFVSPVSGTVRTCAGTHHAFYIDARNGAQLLVHIGVDAHVLRGLGFMPLVSEGQAVHAGQALCLVDLEYLRIAALPTVSSLVLTRSAGRAEFAEPGGRVRGGGSSLGRIVAADHRPRPRG